MVTPAQEPDRTVNTSSGCENASPRWTREVTLKDALALGYPPIEAIAWVCGYNVACTELTAPATPEHGGQQTAVGWLDDDGCLHPDPEGIRYRRWFGPWEQVHPEQSRHDPAVTVDGEGFRIVCTCGWMSAPAPTIGSGPIRCQIALLERSDDKAFPEARAAEEAS